MPPVSALYQLKTGAEVPLVVATVHVGTVGILHSDVDIADGMVGVGLMVKLTGADVAQPVTVFVAST